MDLRPGITTRRLIIGRGIVMGLAAGAALGATAILLLMVGMVRSWLLLRLTGLIGAGSSALGAVAGLLCGLAVAGRRDRMLLDGPRSRVTAGAAAASPFLVVLAWRAACSDQFWPSVCLMLALWCGVAAAMFAPWVVRGTLAKAPSLHE